MRRGGPNDAPMSNRAMVAVVAGCAVAIVLALLMMRDDDKQEMANAEVVSMRERIAELEAEVGRCRAERFVGGGTLEPWESEDDPKPLPKRKVKDAKPEAEHGTPPTRLPLEDTIVLPEVVVTEDELDADAKEWEFAEPPRRLDSDDFQAYVQDPAPDGEVRPGPTRE